MDPVIIGIIGIMLVIILTFLGLPVPVIYFLVGFGGIFLLKGWVPALDIVRRFQYNLLADFNFSLIPLFILLGVILFECGIGEEIFRAAQRWLGHYRGGMGAATSGACAFLGTVTGSGFAVTLLMSKVAYPEMTKVGYDQALSLVICASSATIAMMIPPSTALVIYAVITEQSIAQTLLAGFIPGFLSMGMYMGMILIRARLNPSLGPPSPAVPWRDRLVSLRYLLPAVIMMVTIIGGLYFAVFTATEAGGVACLVAFATAIAMRRLTWARFKATIYETIRLSVMLALILLTIRGFYILFLSITWLPLTMAEVALAMPSPWLTIAAMYLVCFVLGMFTGSPLAYVILPLFTPVVEQLGFEPVWFIITVVKMIETGFITPPIAPGIFIAQNVVREVRLEKAFGAAWWFVLCDMITLALFIAFPQIVMFLPNTMRAGL